MRRNSTFTCPSITALPIAGNVVKWRNIVQLKLPSLFLHPAALGTSEYSVGGRKSFVTCPFKKRASPLRNRAQPPLPLRCRSVSRRLFSLPPLPSRECSEFSPHLVPFFSFHAPRCNEGLMGERPRAYGGRGTPSTLLMARGARHPTFTVLTLTARDAGQSHPFALLPLATQNILGVVV